jgi:hypothetical protein
MARQPLSEAAVAHIVEPMADHPTAPNKPSRKFLGVTPRRWLEYLVAILLGNAIYYLSLPPISRNRCVIKVFRRIGGLLVDFAACAAVYGLICLGSRI